MQAAILEDVERLVVREAPKPAPKADEVLIKVAACGLCGTDAKLYKGECIAKTPVILGHEFSGEAVEVGEAVRHLKVGDWVVSDPNESCGNCEWCRSGRPCFCEDLAAYGVRQNGGFAQFVLVREKGTYRIPPGLDFEQATFTEPVSCAIHAVDRANIKPGESIALIGGGPAGQILLQLAGGAGTERLIMITRSEWKLKLAKKLGATHTICAKKEDVIGAVRDLTAGLGVDVAIEAVGTPQTVELAIDLVKPTGRVIVFGFSPEGKKASFEPFKVLSKELSILGAWVNPYTFSRALDVLACGEIDVKSLISERIKLARISEGFDLMVEKPAGFMKALVVP